MINKEKGYIKKVVTLYIHTSIGDRWKNKEECEFIELKGQEGYVVDEKNKNENSI